MKKRNKPQKTFVRDKMSFKETLGIYKGVPMPWILLALYLISIYIVPKLNIQIISFTGDMLDASGDVPVRDLLLYAATSLLNVVLNVGGSICMLIACAKINRGVREKMWNKMLLARPACYDKEQPEQLISRVTSDCDLASSLIDSGFMLFSMVYQAIIYSMQLFSANGQFGTYIFVYALICYLFYAWVGTKRFSTFQRIRSTLADSTARLVEWTRNLLLIKACSAEEDACESGLEEFDAQYRAGIVDEMILLLRTRFSLLVSYSLDILVYILGSYFISKGAMTPGDVIMIQSFAGAVAVYMEKALGGPVDLAVTAHGLSRVSKALQFPEEDLSGGEALNTANQDVRFEDVTFAYDDTPVLKNVSCVFPHNKVTALIGANGSGKSTLFKLFDRLYDPQSGTVYFGDTDAQAYNLHDWRKSVVLLAQNAPLMAGTIRENITYGCRREVDEAELTKVAKLCGVYDFVKDLPDGFDTQVDLDGRNFSGGQRQCIAIARTMMNNPDYLLLDEPTSNLDAKSEAVVIKALHELAKDRTTIIIAHSLGIIRNADHFVVLRDGQVESTGTPKEVLNTVDSYLAKIMNQYTAPVADHS